MVEIMVMKKLIRHKWRKLYPNNVYDSWFICDTCGCQKHYDFNYQNVMYRWGTHVTYRPPSCLLPNTINYAGKKI